MNDTEFAHWNYRLKVLPDDISKTQTVLADYGAAIATGWGDQHTMASLRAQLETERWLLEEARYMVELGRIQRS